MLFTFSAGANVPLLDRGQNWAGAVSGFSFNPDSNVMQVGAVTNLNGTFDFALLNGRLVQRFVDIFSNPYFRVTGLSASMVLTRPGTRFPVFSRINMGIENARLMLSYREPDDFRILTYSVGGTPGFDLRQYNAPLQVYGGYTYAVPEQIVNNHLGQPVYNSSENDIQLWVAGFSLITEPFEN